MLSAIFILSLFFFFFSVSLSTPDYNALLSFKTSQPNSLSSWVDSVDPCHHHNSSTWSGVTCNPSTHRVTKLVLENLNLTGPIHSLSQLTELRFLSLKNNQLTSTIGLNFSSLHNLKHIYLSRNRFSGQFPAGIFNLRRLQRLDLSNNGFYGEVPMTELTHLPRLLTLRLESNSFTGSLRSPASESIRDLNVSNNKFDGEIPLWMSRFPSSCFNGNVNLNTQTHPLPVNLTAPLSKPSKGHNKAHIVMIAVIIVVVVLVIAVFMIYTIRNTSRPHKITKGGAQKGMHIASVAEAESEEGGMLVVFEGWNLGFYKVSELLKCSAELLGKGSVGTTYKVKLETGGGSLVVKRIRDGKSRRQRKELDGWLEVIGGIRDDNVASLRAYYNSADELLLVYDYLPNGSLYTLLHGNREGPWRTPLDWPTRLNLAAGTAKALSFIHGLNNAKLFHGHLTSSNIIVNESGNACVSDIGLHRLLQAPPPSNHAYKAPELNNSNNNSQTGLMQKADVYSFGVILLEILTGKIAASEEEIVKNVKWIQSVRRESLMGEVFDIELLSNKEREEDMVALLQVVMLCVAPLPKDRPKMSIVDNMIEDIRTKGMRQSRESFVMMRDVSSDSSN
ncbi:hypothetical protein ACFE04_014437 [Oxalis oulophora]